MTNAVHDAARKAAKLQWIAEHYRRHGERNAEAREHAERLADRLEDLAASVLCSGFQRPTAALGIQ